VAVKERLVKEQTVVLPLILTFNTCGEFKVIAMAFEEAVGVVEQTLLPVITQLTVCPLVRLLVV
jgi:hypothetical protein